MFGQVPFANPYQQSFGGYPFHPQQQFGSPFGQQFGGYPGMQWPTPPIAGVGPIGPLVPQPSGLPFAPSFNPGQATGNPLEQMLGIGAANPYGAIQAVHPSWQQRDPRAELLANTIAQITAMRDPRIEYLAQVVTHPVVASNPVLKDLVAKELLTTALQHVAYKTSARPEAQGQTFLRAGEQIGQSVDPYTAAAIRSQVLAGSPSTATPTY
jgi:hypothetical protein